MTRVGWWSSGTAGGYGQRPFMLGKLSLVVLRAGLRAYVSHLSFLDCAVWTGSSQVSMLCRELKSVDRRGCLKRCQSCHGSKTRATKGTF